ISRGPTTATWSGADNAYYAYPPNTGNTAEETLANIQTNKLGFIYQWSAAMAGSTTEGAQGICPAGWHVPTDAEQNTLDQYLKDNGQTCDANRSNVWDCSSAGTKLKLGGTSGFNAPLAGYRGTTGGFYVRGSTAYLWSSSQSGATAWDRYLYASSATVHRVPYSKAYGFSLRCLKD
ncbi:MAG: fibrobacter succinogenes major paralogous domain-containing protein, partial [Candidatus Moraniibacteriota bacterium]